MSSIVDAAKKGEWSGVDCSVLTPGLLPISPQSCCHLGPSTSSGRVWQKGKRLLSTSPGWKWQLSLQAHQFPLLVITIGYMWRKDFLGEICVKSTQCEILFNPVVCITSLKMIVREDTKYLPVTTTSIWTIEREAWKKMTRHCKWGKI